MRRMPRSSVVVLALVGCVEAEPPRTCDVATTRAALGLPERALVGQAAAYDADPTLLARQGELDASMTARRAVAWQVLARVIDPVPVAADVPDAAGDATLPRFRTWYDGADVKRLFRHLYLGMPAADRAARASFTDDAIDDALAWNTHAVDESEGWPAERVDALRVGLDTPAKLAGLGGISRVAFAPSAARHVLASYEEIAACAEGAPRAEGPRRTTSDALALAPCEAHVVGPWALADGESATLTVDGAAALSVVDAAGAPACDASPCTLAGPGSFRGVVTGAVDGGVATIVIDLPPAPVCLADRFPDDAAIVKAVWRRADLGLTLPAYDTSEAAIAARLAGDATWPDAGDFEADPGPDEIVTAELPDGRRYRLAALHVMTRELDSWLWTTMWWSATPNDTLGADRPELPAFAGAFGHYQMCTVTAHAEPGGAATWCSNPYLETGVGNVGTNCLGCHQDAGTGATTIDILSLPDHGRGARRDTFPTDYLWAVTAGDRLGFDFANVLAWDSFH